ncbi:MAG: hypothetical protein FWH44_02875 [Methanomassiliicoccaceae archaeon]|nr:hypothetical protein [Methanomassiliicoccaceae archaeon]
MGNSEEITKARPKGWLFALLVAAVMLTAVVVPAVNASAAERLTDSTRVSGVWVDGIDADRHNSYAWCTAVFEQDDGDYLWVGSNRDLGGYLLAVAGAPAYMNALLGIPAVSPDHAGKIFRYNMDESGDWELMYENDAFSGYRKMIVFNDDLYVFAGLTNTGDGYDYSAVYRFGPDFQYGDEPEVILWAPILSGGAEYFRAACIIDDLLYVGTFDSKIYCTDGTGLMSLTPTVAAAVGEYDGWDLVADLALDYGFTADNYVWDIIGFNGSLYAFVTGMGFMVIKLTDDGLGGYDTDMIVGDMAGTQYPSGLDIAGHVAASPFLATFDGVDYVYVSTFANGPVFLGQLAIGVSLLALNMLPQSAAIMETNFNETYCPAAIYRFTADDEWEVVVGDRLVGNVAHDSDGNNVPNAGNLGGGFFPGLNALPSLMPNMYVWWMAQDENGRLWASTWDMGIFRNSFVDYPDVFQAIVLNMLTQNSDIAAILMSATGFTGGLSAALDNLTGIDYAAAVNTITGIVTASAGNIAAAVMGGNTAAIQTILEQMATDVVTVLQSVAGQVSIANFMDIYNSIVGMYNMLSGLTAAKAQAMFETLSAVFTFTKYVNDTADPAGFDLFYTDDGFTWLPYTVNGLGDATNYGGRVLLPTENGLLLLTANPFNGCQVWNLSKSNTPVITANVPAAVSLNVGESVTFAMRSVGIDPSAVSVTVGDGTVVSVSIRQVSVDRTVYASTVTKVLDLDVYGDYRWEENGGYGYEYEVTLTGLREYSGPIDVDIGSGATARNSSLIMQIGDPTVGPVIEPAAASDDSDNTTVIIVVAAVLVFVALLAVGFIIRK